VKKFFALLFGIALLAIVFLFVSRRSAQEKTTESLPVVHQKKTVLSKTDVDPVGGDTTELNPPRENPTEENAEPPPPPGTVHFRVEDGLAIAHGDIILGTPDEPTTTSGNYTLPDVQYWRTAEIPYAIEEGLPDPERVKAALKHIETKTGFQFVPFSGQPDSVVFRVGKKDCLSALGRQGGMQPIKIDRECGWHEITHELLHTMGFIHEQSRSDRDKYVEILWPNIVPELKDQFDLLPEDFLGPAKDTAFDYHSIMLYDATAFSKHGQPTLRSKTNDPVNPSKQGLSPSDIARVKSFYSLKGR
jgi:hypothetical protein